MKFHIYQIVIGTISAIMIYNGIENYLKGRNGQTFLKVLVRVIVWGGMTVIAIFPTFTNNVAEVIGMEGNINAVILVGFIFVFLMIFKLLSAIERLEQQITAVTRDESLFEIKDKK
ncbi:MAG: DUF2304 domain-containing protein [Parcubacteria group bacterium]|jgi:hypothetical protein